MPRQEFADELRGFASAMRELARRPAVDPALQARAIDIVGTGGDASGSVNISTGTALLVAACGLPVIKHGNRSISSRSGSADVLEQLGLPLPLDETRAGACLTATGFTFLFAPHYHPAMKEIAPVRRALGVRTVFNLLGPLTNPAEPPFGLIGAYSHDAARLMAETLAGMPIQRVFVVHGEKSDWQFQQTVSPSGGSIFSASQKTSRVFNLAEGERVSYSVDVVQGGAKDSFAILAFIPTANSPGTLGGYGLAKSTTDILITKGINKYFVADDGTAANLKQENITLNLTLNPHRVF